MPGEASQRVPVQWGVETIVDPWVLLPHQHLSTHTTKRLTAVYDKNVLEEHFSRFLSILTMTIRVMFVGPRASRVSGPSVGRL